VWHRRLAWLAPLLLLTTTACGEDPPASGADAGPVSSWQLVQRELPGALLSVWGASSTDVWIVGADARDGTGPIVLHYEGGAFERLQTGQTQGDLWWVFGFSGGPVYMGGAGGVILRYEGGTFTKMTTPTTDTVFGIWGSAPDDVWAVGGTVDSNGFAWRLQGDAWVEGPSFPVDVSGAAIWKIFGTSKSDAWLVGSSGMSFHWDGAALTVGQTGVGSSLFTVHANARRYVAVGGLATGIIVENEGSGWAAAPGDAAPYGVTGVSLAADDRGVAVGQYGSVYLRDADGWHAEETGFSIQEDLHGALWDSAGEIWAVGGRTASYPLVEGVLLHKGQPIMGGGI